MKSILTLLFLTHFTLTSLAQGFDTPPPPPPMEENSALRKKLTPAELKLEVSEKAPNLLKSPIKGFEFNWSDANLWVCQDKKESDVELTAFYYFMNGSKAFRSDSVWGELLVKIIPSPFMLGLDAQETIIQNTMQSQYTGSEFKTIWKKKTDKENRIIFKVDRIPIGDDYFKSVVGQVVQIEGKILILTYTNNTLPEHVEKIWVKRLSNVEFR